MEETRYYVVAWNNGEDKDILLDTTDLEYAIYFAGEASYEFDHALVRDEYWQFY